MAFPLIPSRIVQKNKLKTQKIFGDNVCIIRNQHDKINIFRDQCPHRGVTLSCGKLKNNSIYIQKKSANTCTNYLQNICTSQYTDNSYQLKLLVDGSLLI